VADIPRITMGQDTIKLTLSFHHRQMLRFIAEAGGHIHFKFGSTVVNGDGFTDEEKAKLVKDSDDSLRQMGTMGLLKITPMIGHADTVELSLTDIGRNVIDQMGIPILKIDSRTNKEIKGF
jgi:hypothetical protein